MNAGKPKLADRLLLRISQKTEIGGLWVGSIERDANLLMKVGDALELIGRFDPLRHCQIRRYLTRIWIRLLPGDVAQFEPSLQACLLDTRFVRDCSADFIAAAMVHEATHARLFRCGIGYDVELRDRIERVCILQEIAFARKLPNGDTIEEWARLGLSTPFDLKDEAFDARRQDGALEILRHRRVPDRLIRLLLGVRRILRR
jgi:hypothetical protein